MVPLEKLRGIIVPEEYKHVYKHYLEQEEDQVEKAYSQLIGILNADNTNKKVSQVNQKIKSQTPYNVFMDKAYQYFLKILYVIIHDNDEPKRTVSIKTCMHDACEYAVAEYLAFSLIKSI